jgi:hypothetical protein
VYSDGERAKYAVTRVVWYALLAIIVSGTGARGALRHVPWNVAVSGHVAGDVGVSVGNGRVAVFTPERLCVYRPPETTPRWCVASTATSVAFEGRRVAYADRFGRVVALDATDGMVQWSACLFRSCRRRYPFGLVNGPVITAVPRGFVAYATNPAQPDEAPFTEFGRDGTRFWSIQLPGAIAGPELLYKHYLVQTVMRLGVGGEVLVVSEGPSGGRILRMPFRAETVLPTAWPVVIIAGRKQSAASTASVASIEVALVDMRDARADVHRTLPFAVGTPAEADVHLVATDHDEAYFVAGGALYAADIHSFESVQPRKVRDIAAWLGDGFVLVRQGGLLQAVRIGGTATQRLRGIGATPTSLLRCGDLLVVTLQTGSRVVDDLSSGKELSQGMTSDGSDVVCASGHLFKRVQRDDEVRLTDIR